MIKVYNDAYYAFKDLTEKKKDLSEAERDRLVKYVFTSPTYCCQFLEQELFKNSSEKDRAFQRVITSYEAASKLVTGVYKSKLSDMDISWLVETALEHWSSALTVYKAGLLNDEQKIRAFDIITLNQYSIVDFLKSGMANMEQRMFLLNETSVADIADIIIKYYQLKPTEKFDDRPDRKQSMDMQFRYAYRIYEYAKKGLLTKDELTLAYEKWNKVWFDEYKYQFEPYYEYCKIFQEYLNDHELKIFFGKFNKKNNNTWKLKQACSDFHVPEMKIKLEALCVCYTLKKAATRR